MTSIPQRQFRRLVIDHVVAVEVALTHGRLLEVLALEARFERDALIGSMLDQRFAHAVTGMRFAVRQRAGIFLVIKGGVRARGGCICRAVSRIIDLVATFKRRARRCRLLACHPRQIGDLAPHLTRAATCDSTQRTA